MKQFGEHLVRLLLWLLLSEVFCLVLAFSFALLGGALPLRIAGMLCGITAHVLLMYSTAKRTAEDDLRTYRQTGNAMPRRKPLLFAVCGMLPAFLLYLLLMLRRDSVLMQNLFLLLNAPMIGLYRLLFGGHEPFSAVPLLQRLLTAFPPLLTGIALLAGYLPHYRRGIAACHARSSRG
ncbi:MAG: hypothetical protein J5722_12265 [Oscillospiraceae bacterium]|nr:hypothetical protein [Oscillospiraceae bacterium]